MGIPECVHRLSKYWDQPKNTEVEIDDSHALMSQKSFEELPEYSCSIPTGVYAGKMWKARKSRDEWLLRWYEYDPTNPHSCRIHSRIILIVK